MADPHEHLSKTSFDATMGDLFAAGLYGDPVRDNFAGGKDPTIRRNRQNLGQISPKRRLAVASWFIAVFVISAVASPYILN